MNNEIRTYMFFGVAGMVLALIFLTPYGLLWGVIVYGLLAVIIAIFEIDINIMLWGILWLLLSISIIWFSFIGRHGLPEVFFKRMERRIRYGKSG